MTTITLSEEIKQASPNIKLGAIEAKIAFEKHNDKLWAEINTQIERISKLSTQNIKEIPQILSTRDAYKNLGKEPTRYRPSAEALHRRIIQGKGMYKISNLVDSINLASIISGYSIGGYDSNKIFGNITFGKGKKEDDYRAIGRGTMNIESLPVFYDEVGPFGSPTSDSERTMITEKTTTVLWIVINFGGHNNFEVDLSKFDQILQNYCSAQNIQKIII
ncbi:MAG: hypothetical protein JXR36_17155 [Bacteroidales bacterium]|nr:hypothetical protein [Bacteroidales bacterium]